MWHVKNVTNVWRDMPRRFEECRCGSILASRAVSFCRCGGKNSRTEGVISQKSSPISSVRNDGSWIDEPWRRMTHDDEWWLMMMNDDELLLTFLREMSTPVSMHHILCQFFRLFCDWHMLRALAMKPFPRFPRRWRNLEKKSWTRERMGKGIRSGCKARRILGVSLKATSQYQSYTAPKQHTAYSPFQQFFVCSFQVQVLRFLSYLAVASEMIQRPVVCVAAFHIFSSSQFKRFLPLTRKCTAVKMMVFNIVQQNMCHLPGLLVLTRSKVGQRMLKV